MGQRNALLRRDDGITLIEVVATLVIMMLLMPAIYTSYATAARSSEATLQRLRCLGIARQELEARKAEGYEALLTYFSTGQTSTTIPQTNFGDSGIDLATALEKTTVADPSNTTVLPALRVRITASIHTVHTTVNAIVVSGGY